MNALTLADFILASYPNKNITPMKLQKLAFYAKVWTLVADKPFINASFEKWPYGPVNSDIYQAYQAHGKNVIPSPNSLPNIPTEQAQLLKFILSEYVDYSAFSLSAMTHNEAPWQKTPHKQIISSSAIFKHYSMQSFASNFKGEKSKFYVLKSPNWHSFTLDMTQEDAASFLSMPSHATYIEQSEAAEEDWEQLLESISSNADKL